MEFTGDTLSGGYGATKDYKIAATVVAGQPVLFTSTAGDAGGWITDPTTTNMDDAVGLVLGATARIPDGGRAGSLTYSTTQGDTEGYARVVISPHAIFKARMSGSATTGAALATYTNTTANAAGTTFTATLGTATMDGGTIFMTAGSNTGLSRRITTFTASTSLVVTVPFPNTISTSDVAMVVPYRPTGNVTMQLVTDFTEADASIAVGTGAAIGCVELQFDHGNPTTSSYVLWVIQDHVFGGRPT